MTLKEEKEHTGQHSLIQMGSQVYGRDSASCERQGNKRANTGERQEEDRHKGEERNRVEKGVMRQAKEKGVRKR